MYAFGAVCLHPHSEEVQRNVLRTQYRWELRCGHLASCLVLPASNLCRKAPVLVLKEQAKFQCSSTKQFSCPLFVSDFPTGSRCTRNLALQAGKASLPILVPFESCLGLMDNSKTLLKGSGFVVYTEAHSPLERNLGYISVTSRHQCPFLSSICA